MFGSKRSKRSKRSRRFRIKVLGILGLLVLGVVSYVSPYVLLLEFFSDRSLLPFIEVAEFLNSTGSLEGVFTMHPDLLARYYKGPIFQIPEKAGFEDILEQARTKGARYLVIESTCINSLDLLQLFYHFKYPGKEEVPSEFVLLKSRASWIGSYGLYFIQTEVWFKAVIFAHVEWEAHIHWERTLSLIGATTDTFNDTTIVSSIDLSEYDVAVFADFMRNLDDDERLYLENSVQNGSVVVVSGISPEQLTGGTRRLTQISRWFGATEVREAPEEARWNVNFTEDATEIFREIDLNRQYEFYLDFDWSTPVGCIVLPESIVYAHRVNDLLPTIFLHGFGQGTSIFVGPRYGFESVDKEIFEPFIRSLILSVLD